MYRVREMRDRDVEEVSAIEQASFGEPWSREAFESLLTHQHMEALVLSECCEEHPTLCAVVGYCGLITVLDEAEITNIAVRADRRGHGYGQMLLSDVLRRLADGGTHQVYLEVRVSNYRAIHIYEKAGFRQVGIRKHFYSNPTEDGYLMRLEIPAAGDRSTTEESSDI